MNDEKLLLEATKEASSPERDKKLWVKALSISAGDREKAKYVYVKMRVKQLKSHQEASQELKVEGIDSEAFSVVSDPEKKKEHDAKKDLNLPSDNDNYSDLVQKNNTEVPVEKIIDPELKVCPYCAEDIKYNAIVCRYCGKDINVKKLEIHKVEVSQTKLEKPMNSVIWIIILSASIVFYARETNLEYSIGYTIPWFVIGMVLSGIWWFAARKRKKLSWKWFDWLNVAAYIMLFLFVIKFSVHHYMNL